MLMIGFVSGNARGSVLLHVALAVHPLCVVSVCVRVCEREKEGELIVVMGMSTRRSKPHDAQSEGHVHHVTTCRPEAGCLRVCGVRLRCAFLEYRNGHNREKHELSRLLCVPSPFLA